MPDNYTGSPTGETVFFMPYAGSPVVEHQVCYQYVSSPIGERALLAMSKNRSKGGRCACCLNNCKVVLAHTFYPKNEKELKKHLQKLGG